MADGLAKERVLLVSISFLYVVFSFLSVFVLLFQDLAKYCFPA